MRSAFFARGGAARKIAATAALCGLLTACTGTGPEVREVSPTCSPAEQPPLPDIRAEAFNGGTPTENGGRLLEPGESYLTDELFNRTRKREKRLVDWALELHAQVESVCEPPED